MRKVMNGKNGGMEGHYYAINYLAKQCDPIALKKLSSGRYRGQTNGMQYATSLELFGKCKYRPAIPHLLEELDDFSGNAAGGAEFSLQELYPDHPKLEAFDAIKQYYCDRARKEGFKVHCEQDPNHPSHK